MAGLSRRTFLGAAGAAGLATVVGGQLAAAAPGRPRAAGTTVYVGSYTSTPPAGHGLDVVNRRSSVLTPVRTVPDASWFDRGRDGRTLYVTNESDPEGAISALDVSDAENPRLLGSVSSKGSAPTHLSVHSIPEVRARGQLRPPASSSCDPRRWRAGRGHGPAAARRSRTRRARAPGRERPGRRVGAVGRPRRRLHRRVHTGHRNGETRAAPAAHAPRRRRATPPDLPLERPLRLPRPGAAARAHFAVVGRRPRQADAARGRRGRARRSHG